MFMTRRLLCVVRGSAVEEPVDGEQHRAPKTDRRRKKPHQSAKSDLIKQN